MKTISLTLHGIRCDVDIVGAYPATRDEPAFRGEVDFVDPLEVVDAEAACEWLGWTYPEDGADDRLDALLLVAASGDAECHELAEAAEDADWNQ